MPQRDHAALQTAAVIGRQIDPLLLCSLHPELDLQAWLMHCLEASIVTVANETWSFAHDKLRDGILYTLDAGALAKRHAQVAASIEAFYPLADYAIVLMQHWHKAGDSAKELTYCRMAAEKSLRVSAFRAARQYLERARTLHPPHTRPTGSVGRSLLVPGRVCRGRKCAPAGPAPSNRHRGLERDVLAEPGRRAPGDFSTAQRYLQQALAACDDVDPLTLARIQYGLGDIAWRLGDFETATVHITACWQLANQLNDASMILYAANRLGSIAFFQGDLDLAERYHLKNRALALSVGNRERASAAISNLGEIARLRGDYPAARRHYEESLCLSEEIQQDQSVLVNLTNLGLLSLAQNDLATAHCYFLDILQLSLQHQALTTALYGLMGCAEILARRGDTFRAATWVYLITQHAAADVNVQNDIRPFQEQLEARLTPHQQRIAREEGQALFFDEIALAILQGEVGALLL
ncbi:MAG: tetratricopeptide repeat protein [Anaerolineae bacterium]|nr:tetratricopeptide repeat protein [Anaerolineae bacterium]